MDFNRLAEETKRRIVLSMHNLPKEELICKARCAPNETPFPFERAIAGDRFNVIGSIFKSNPFKPSRQPNRDFPHTAYAAAYQSSGVAAIRVATEPSCYRGHNSFIKDIQQATALPILRFDFVITAYQIYYSKLLGANAVDLIAAIMSTEQLNEFITLSRNLNMSAVVHAFSKQTVRMALRAGAKIICIDSLNPRTGKVDYDNVKRLRPEIPDSVTLLADRVRETPENFTELKRSGVNGIIMSDRFMRCRSKTGYLSALGFTKN